MECEAGREGGRGGRGGDAYPADTIIDETEDEAEREPEEDVDVRDEDRDDLRRPDQHLRVAVAFRRSRGRDVPIFCHPFSCEGLFHPFFRHFMVPQKNSRRGERKALRTEILGNERGRVEQGGMHAIERGFRGGLVGMLVEGGARSERRGEWWGVGRSWSGPSWTRQRRPRPQ